MILIDGCLNELITAVMCFHIYSFIQVICLVKSPMGFYTCKVESIKVKS